MKTRAEIDAELQRLEQRLSRLVGECEPDEVLEAFAGEAHPGGGGAAGRFSAACVAGAETSSRGIPTPARAAG